MADLQERLRATPEDPRLLVRLGAAYLTRARETADPSYYGRAEEALRRSHEIDARWPGTLVGLGLLAMARHDFAVVLDLARQAQTLAPGAAEPLGLAYDALVELGRYDEAAAAVQAMVDRRPSFAGLIRVAQLAAALGISA